MDNNQLLEQKEEYEKVYGVFKLVDLTMRNMEKVFKDNELNVLIYISVEVRILFVNSEQEKYKLEDLDDIRPFICDFIIKVEEYMIINGVVILQSFNTSYFDELESLKKEKRLRGYNSFKSRFKRLLKL